MFVGMARPLRMDFPGAIHHVTSRMVGRWADRRERLFRDERDYQRFLDRLEEGVRDFGVRLYLYCLMSNHFHLVVETPQANLSRFIQRLATAYTVYFNLRHRRHGHLLDGRFKAKVVSGDDYLLKLSRYVHQNPVWVAAWAKQPLAERVDRLRNYRWSSYPGYAGISRPEAWVDQGPVLAMMSGRGSQKRKTYRGFVEAGLARADEEFQEAFKAPGLAIGDEHFRQWVEEIRGKLLKGRPVKQDVAFRRIVAPLPVAKVLEAVCEAFGVESEMLKVRRKNSPLRAVAARLLVRYAGQTQRQVAGWLGVGTGTAIAEQLRRLKEWQGQDRELNRLITRLETDLEARREPADRKSTTSKGRKR